MREEIPDLGLTTDVIVGFPTETDAEYEDTRRTMEDVRFDAAFIFKYSERKGTVAQKKLPDDVPPESKTERIMELIGLQQRVTNEINQALVGTVHDVLIEECSQKDYNRLIGRTDNFKTTIVPAAGYTVGNLVPVTIVEAKGATLFGRPVRNAAYAT
jgi:tRNA-2-methylthio-N6-dimethylallyladenosine synthase